MFKEFFDNKKVAIFDLETIINNNEALYRETFENMLLDLNIDWIYLPDVLKGGKTIEEVWEEILLDPYIDKKIPLQQLINATYTKFINVINNTEDLDTKEGFWPFTDELKEDFNYKLVLKSELNETLTNALIEKLELNDLFDLIIVQKTEKRKNLYTEILKLLKSYKLTNEECIAFESHPLISKDSAKNNILTIAIKNDDTLAEDFSYKVSLTQQDFSKFVGNIDKTYREAFLEVHPNIKKHVEKMTPSTDRIIQP